MQAVVDPEVADDHRDAQAPPRRRRRAAGLQGGRRWVDVRSPDINAYLKAATGLDVSAKDFRTWGATVLAAVGLGVTEPRASASTQRKRAIVRAVKEVAFYLGNTPTVARNSYIDPRIFDRYRDGQTITPELDGIAADATARRSRGRSRRPCSISWRLDPGRRPERRVAACQPAESWAAATASTASSRVGGS